MADDRLLMIPGPIEVSRAVRKAYSTDPPSHLADDLVEAFGSSLEKMREVWRAGASSQPFIVAGSGTLAMEMAVWNLIDSGDDVLVVDTGYFSDRMADMLERRGAEVVEVSAGVGDVPELDEVERVASRRDFEAMFVTHVDTSTGVRTRAEELAAIADRGDMLSVFDGVCATAGERFEMEEWGVDLYLTASQKAIGLPPGLALLVASERAMTAREDLEAPPPKSLDFHEWLPIMNAYEARTGSYFATPATNLVNALTVGLDEILETGFGDVRGVEARFRLHEHVGRAMRAAWNAMGLTTLPATDEIAANTLSAVEYPDGVDSSLVEAIEARGIVVAGGLYPGREDDYFRVGHMGWVTTRPDELVATVSAIEDALIEAGHPIESGAGVAAFEEHLDRRAIEQSPTDRE